MGNGETTYRSRASREIPCGTFTGDVVVDGPLGGPCASAMKRRPKPNADAPPIQEHDTTPPHDHTWRPDDDSLDA